MSTPTAPPAEPETDPAEGLGTGGSGRDPEDNGDPEQDDRGSEGGPAQR